MVFIGKDACSFGISLKLWKSVVNLKAWATGSQCIVTINPEFYFLWFCGLSVAENEEVYICDLLGCLRLLGAFAVDFKRCIIFHGVGWFAYEGGLRKPAWLQLSSILTCTVICIHTHMFVYTHTHIYMYVHIDRRMCCHCGRYHVSSVVEGLLQRAWCSWPVGCLDLWPDLLAGMTAGVEGRGEKWS